MWVPALRGPSLLLVLCVSLAALSAVPTDRNHPFSVHDMLTMDRLSDPQANRPLAYRC